MIRPSQYKGNMMRPLLHIRSKYELVLTTPDKGQTMPDKKQETSNKGQETSNKGQEITSAYYPTFKIPVETFLNAGAVWTELNLSTIFWEPPAYGITRTSTEKDNIKKSYLLAFPTYDAPICKAWADDCLLNNKYNEYGAYFELTIWEVALVEKIKNALSRHGVKCVHGEDNFITTF